MEKILAEHLGLEYCSGRLNTLGITGELNAVKLWQKELIDNDVVDVLVDFPIFTGCAKGIQILTYTLDRKIITYGKDKQYNTVNIDTTGKSFKEKHKMFEAIASGEVKIDKYCIIRLREPKVHANGDVMKYYKPKGVLSYPFLPPQLLDSYDKREAIPVLYITEGAFKAFKACMHGIPCVGVQSITCLTNKETNLLWEDITTLVTTCKVERLVWLTDGDCNQLTHKAITEETDLYNKPNAFFESVSKFQHITSSLKDVERYFAHINSEELAGRTKKPELELKGLDDILVALPLEHTLIAEELLSFHRMAAGKLFPGKYVTKISVTNNVNKVREYFNLHNLNQFYMYHVERRKELKELKMFTYYGSTYKWNEEKCEAEKEVPAEVAKYILVGNDYYYLYEGQDAFGNKYMEPLPRTEKIIARLIGKAAIMHIPYYHKFTSVPSHINYQRIINDCYNRYAPFLHEPDEECTIDNISTTITFFKHLFSTEMVAWEQGGVAIQCERWELVLDYITVLYRYPERKLPILCLVSEERQTGKTSFGNYLERLFCGNVANILNDDLKAEFNSNFASKLLIVCDETKIDKSEVVEKIKSLSSKKNIDLHSKGKDKVTIPFCGKFVLMSNHVDDFIRIDKSEIRFWIHKVPALAKVDVDMEQKLQEEIPAFVHILNTRKMKYAYPDDRAWFRKEVLVTDVLKNVMNESVPNVIKEAVEAVESLFYLAVRKGFSGDLRLPLEYICELVGKKGENRYIGKMLNKHGYACGSPTNFTYPKKVINSIIGGNGLEVDIIYIKADGLRPYLFKYADFIKDVPETEPQQPTNPYLPINDNYDDF